MLDACELVLKSMLSLQLGRIRKDRKLTSRHTFFQILHLKLSEMEHRRLHIFKVRIYPTSTLTSSTIIAASSKSSVKICQMPCLSALEAAAAALALIKEQLDLSEHLR
jgi:hypothetical protein